jgi:hypothetical protein
VKSPFAAQPRDRSAALTSVGDVFHVPDSLGFEHDETVFHGIAGGLRLLSAPVDSLVSNWPAGHDEFGVDSKSHFGPVPADRVATNLAPRPAYWAVPGIQDLRAGNPEGSLPDCAPGPPSDRQVGLRALRPVGLRFGSSRDFVARKRHL